MDLQCISKRNRWLKNCNEKTLSSVFYASGNRTLTKSTTPNSDYISTGTSFFAFYNFRASSNFIPNCYNNAMLCHYREGENVRTYKKFASFVLPLSAGSSKKARRANTIIKGINTPCMQKYKTKKGEIYYSGCGIILNEKKKPIVIFGHKVEDSRCINDTILVSKENCCDANGTVEKYIIKELIPEVFEASYSSCCRGSTYNRCVEIITRMNDMITIPKQANSNTLSPTNYCRYYCDEISRQLWMI